ncbi:MAG: hypothetical protein HY248_03225, partial [Fimbriimonas ginsengisoli]|nr:hypothetical protein [Fimbriimonas ginsengisoli]
MRLFAALAALVSILPALYALIAAPPGARYLGIQTNLDDHMVYAAWMRQAMDGHILFDNRFTTDAQPGLTVNVFFFALGLFAKVLGIPLAMTLARAGFSALFVWLAYRLIRQVAPDVYATKLALTLTTVAGGLGFVVWHTFGQTIVRPEAKFLAGPLNGRLPTDVWQPEGFVFPSMLTSALFMASLCLILYVLLCVLAARAGAKSVVPGALAMAALMNIHSYDVLLVGFIMLGLLMATAARGDVDWRWVGRSALILLGALPAALWFLYVLRHDPVFQVRAATPTFSPGFRQVVFGYLPALALGLLGLAMARFGDEVPAKQRRVGTGLLTVAIAVMFAVGASQGNGYWMEAAAWTAMAVLFLVLIGLLAEDSPAWNLIVSWAALGLIAPYFPALFQRKLAMGLAIPWAILAALG